MCEYLILVLFCEIGDNEPTHYHVLYDEIRFSAVDIFRDHAFLIFCVSFILDDFICYNKAKVKLCEFRPYDLLEIKELIHATTFYNIFQN